MSHDAMTCACMVLTLLGKKGCSGDVPGRDGLYMHSIPLKNIRVKLGQLLTRVSHVTMVSLGQARLGMH